MPQNSDTDTDTDMVMSAYREICENYRAIDDFRAKLLALLPIVSAGGIFFLIQKDLNLSLEYLLPIGIFGVVVTAGLYAYELHGIRKCSQLIKLGQHIEDDKKFCGPFTNRPGGVELPFRKKEKKDKNEKRSRINELLAARIIYPAVMAAWMYVGIFKCCNVVAAVVAAITYIVGFAFLGMLELKGEGVSNINNKQSKQTDALEQ
jgi:hypothetical protein